MAFWQRIGKSKLKIVCTHAQFHRCYIQLPHASSLNSTPKPRLLEMPHPYWVFHDRPKSVCSSVRFFAAPVQFQAKWKKEEDNTSGPRLNEQIKAQYVRLVMDDGHSIVSKFEALERARKLKLDLVEVQKNANPPVCKIMDFHKETYKRQEKEKERSKSKSEVTLRRGECKEVRFSEKTELKDLKMKADMVIKLMEKGYRVKCRATGKENQDLTGSLSRLSALIEDVAVVESGPNLARKEAFMIVRHVKYGPSKKGGGGGKKLQDAAHMAVKAQEGNMESLIANSSDSIEYENQSCAESWFEPEEEVLSDGDKHISLSMDGSDKNFKDRNNTSSVFGNNVNRTTSPDNQTNAAPKAFFPSKSNDSVSPVESENRYRRADHPSEYKVPSNAQVPPVVTDNRYKRVEPRNRFQQTASNNTGLNNKGPGIRDAFRSTPSNLNQMRHVPVDINVNSKTENTKQAVTPGSRNPMPFHEDIPKHGLSHPSAPNIPRPGYGIFSAPNGPETQGVKVKAGMHRKREGSSQVSTRQPFNRESG